MGMQVPCSMDTEIPKEGAVRSTAKAPWRIFTRVMPAEGGQDTGRAPAARPRSCVDIDTTEVFRITGDRFYKREERDPYSANVFWSEEKLQWDAFLGSWLFCFDSWSR